MSSQTGLQDLPIELLTLIVFPIVTLAPSYSEDEDDWSYYRAADIDALVSLTRTCRTLSDLALNWLWEELPSIAPLVYTLPRHMWTIEDTDARDPHASTPIRTMRLVGPIAPGDLGRFHHYAVRVKCMGFSDSTRSNSYPRMRSMRVHSDLMQALEAAHGTSLITPNLQSMVIRYDHHGLVPTTAFISPSLRQVSYRICLHQNAPVPEQDLLQGLKVIHHCGHLRDLELWSLPYPYGPGYLGANLTATISALLENLPALERLKMSLDSGLHLGVQHDSELPLLPQRPKPLRHASLTMDAAEAVDSLLHRIAGVRLEGLKVRLTHRASHQSIHKMFAGLAERHPQLKALDLVHIPYSGVPQNGSQAGEAPASMLVPLLRLSQLSELNIGEFRIAVDDPLVQDMSMAWPKLVSLTIGEYCDVRDAPHLVSLSSLAYFAHRCKHLQALTLPVNTNVPLPPLSQVPSIPFAFGLSDSPLKTLEVGYSTISNPAAVAAYLSDLFPDLACISNEWRDIFRFLDNESEEQFRRWEEVERLIPTFVDVRFQERKAYQDADPIPLDEDADPMIAAMENAQMLEMRERFASKERARELVLHTFCRTEMYDLT